jgi:hypothetical protein
VKLPVSRVGLCKGKVSEKYIVKQSVNLFEKKRAYEDSAESC